ncbi:Cell wall integrity and stress response component 4 [Talaromyces islandicus]|uniref:Cell wall integrity and stress response component 4 n=1 Tax=Talaromyces islandicus TaxID=28573 RepID=A0A0U1LWB8_TALIS|nr:Cell wall integrity and stress response component 4 [Talaromyces islandicus]
MKFSSTATRLGAVAGLLASSPAVAMTIEYCSKENTAASDTLGTSIFQSNGRCETQCNADYAFAVVQYKSCWCTNYIPASQTSVGDCDSPCPGYPDDLCGNADKGLYGYIEMSNVQPSGTSGAAGSTSSTTSSGSSTSSTSSGDSATTTAPNVSVHTVAGQPVTVTVGNSDPAQTSSGSATTAQKSSSLSGGAIAGIVIGCLLGVGALAAAGLWFFFFGRRRNESHEKSPTPESRYDPSTPGTASDAQRQSRGSQMTFMRNFMGSSEPATSPNDYLNPNRAFTDNRMKKDAALYPNGSRHSAVSLRDEEDYSRPVLRLTNPD